MPDGLDSDTQPLKVQGGGPATGWVLGGRYRVVDRVGSGGMAEVFRAHDDLLNRDVAVKVFRTLLDDPDGSTNGATRRELELQSMAQLNHPNLITLYDGAVAGDGPSYLVLEFVDGPDLASRLRDGPLPEPQVRDLGAQIGDALAYVHAHGLVHRDVKPANILLGSEEEHALSGRIRARLSDFGIVRMIGSPQVTSTDLTVGTAYYIAPEQARGSSVGPEADVYALGLVLLEALTGTRAFDGPMHEALAARLTTSPAIPADLPEPWPAVLAGMTAQDPAARPTAAEVAQNLSAGIAPVIPASADARTAAIAVAPMTTPAGSAVPAAPAKVAAMAAPAAAAATSGPVRTRRRRGRLLPVLLLAAAVLAAAVAFGTFLLQSDPTGAPAGSEPTTPTGAPTTSSSPSPSRSRSPAPAAEINTTPDGDRTKTRPTQERTTNRPSSSARPSDSGQASTSAPRTTSSAPSSTGSTPPSTSTTPSSSTSTSPDAEEKSTSPTSPVP